MNKPEQLQPADLGEILFQAAVAQGRADALKAAAKKAAKELAHDPTTQRMLDSFAKMRRKEEQERTQAEIDAEANVLFNRAELGGIRGML